ncbi:ribonuclease S-2-like [Trifolium pratense]|uniref:ribonuclease S-2-like n=1 Tax=Trifolium pratense TaxID=57577 RepID=UPI001E697478|nr:ribonuclease S-2-like [Trifolium pratense]
MLAETWPPSFCQTKTCISTIPSKFSIHGLWPQNNSSPQPRQCTTTKILEKELKPLKPRIANVWPSLTGNNFGLWNHEWTVHGTCSTMAAFDYFKLALDLYAKSNIKDLLQKKNITPGKGPINRKDIEDAIKVATGGLAPQLSCDQNSGNLLEVRLCFDTSTNPKYKNCSTNTNCPLNNVYLPL